MTFTPDNGIVTLNGRRSVDQIVTRLQELLSARGVRLFTLIDHSGEAEKAGLHMRPAKLLIFGNPKAGTPLMIVSPTVAIDLPLKILVWEDTDGTAQLSYNSPAYLQGRHRLPRELLVNLAVIEELAEQAAG